MAATPELTVDSPNDLVSKADKALYEAKESGRTRCAPPRCSNLVNPDLIITYLVAMKRFGYKLTHR